jgi:hypothetical protein
MRRVGGKWRGGGGRRVGFGAGHALVAHLNKSLSSLFSTTACAVLTPWRSVMNSTFPVSRITNKRARMSTVEPARAGVREDTLRRGEAGGGERGGTGAEAGARRRGACRAGSGPPMRPRANKAQPRTESTCAQ